jgi:hypothetical protein
MNPSKTIRRQPDLVQQALFYKGFVELFGRQHSGNSWQHAGAFVDSLAAPTHSLNGIEPFPGPSIPPKTARNRKTGHVPNLDLNPSQRHLKFSEGISRRPIRQENQKRLPSAVQKISNIFG